MIKKEIKNEDALRVIARGILEDDPFKLGQTFMTQNDINVNVELRRRDKYSGDPTADIVITVTFGDTDDTDTDRREPECVRWWDPRTWAVRHAPVSLLKGLKSTF